jgi:photosystem II stability/assembly factor-like uncharacterized protein
MKTNIITFLFALVSISIYGQKKTTNTVTVKEEKVSSSTFSALTWRSIGPAVTSGRVSDFAVDPRNNNVYYVATSSGGVWKTTNRGTTYEPIFDGEGSYSIGCVTLDPSNPNTVWVGSGENNNQRSVAYGDGVYRSDNGGKSWKNMGLKKSEHIANIVVDPKDSKIVYVAAYGPVWSEGGERGVYKSQDGGETWKCVKSVSNFTGCNNLVMDPRDSKVLYAAFHQRMRKVHSYISGGPETALYKSLDGGETWTQLKSGLPSGDLGRMGLDISPVNPDILYIVVEAGDDKGGIYRSTNRGLNWEKRSGYYTSGNYYNELHCDPHNADKFYITDTYYKVSTDGGKSTSNIGEINKHIDNHAIWVDPKDPNHLLIGCDGGIYETYDNAKTYSYKANLPITQFYKVATDNDLPFYSVHGGTQDNFSLGGPSRTTSENGISNAEWYVTSTGDGFETQVDQSNPNIIYAQSQYGGLVRFDRSNGEMLPIKPIEGENEAALRWNWDAPLLISNFDNKRLYFGANKVFRTDDRGNSWTAISPDLSRGVDRNTFELMGRVWSADAVAKNGSTDIFGQTTSIAESPLDANTLWVGTDDGLIHLTTDGGKNWSKFDNLTGVPSLSYVHQIIASQHDKNTAYVCFNHHRYGDFKPYVLKTSDGGRTWKSIASDLPERGSVYTIGEDHVDKDLLFVGTEFSFFFSQNGGTNWNELKTGLPTIAVRDLEIQRRENDLVIATFGRGFYVIDDYSPLRQVKDADIKKDGFICDVKDALMFVPRKPLGLKGKGHLGSDYYMTPNPEVGAVITYFVKDVPKTVKQKRQEREEKMISNKETKIPYPAIDSLRVEDSQQKPYLLFTITNEKGDVIIHVKKTATKGLQRMTWDMRYAPNDPVNNRYFPGPDELWGSSPQGQFVTPGKYNVSMSMVFDGEVTQLAGPKPFIIKLLNQASLPARDLADNHAFCRKVSDITKILSGTNDRVRKIRSRTADALKAVYDMPSPVGSMIKELHALEQSLSPINIALNGDRTKASREMETTPSINDRIGTIEYAIWNSTSDVPKTYKDSYDIAVKQHAKLLPLIGELEDKLNAIESQLDKNKAPYSDGRYRN